MATQEPTTMRTEGVAALADRVLTAPERGSGYFFPTAAGGTAVWVIGFAFSLALLSLANAEWINLTALGIIVPVAYAVGALGMIIGSLWEFRANNLFGAVAGVGYGAFWLSLALLLQFFAGGIVEATGAAGFADAVGAYQLLWALFTVCLLVAAWFVGRTVFVVFALLVAVFVLLALSNFSAPGDTADALRKFGGYVGLVDAAVAWYVFTVLVVNTTAGRNVLPLK